MSSTDIPDNAPAPRLCIIVQWPEFQGYGFNLHADKSRPGQYIGKVDANSPAELAGLLEGDRIIEVNGVNIANENHKQVVSRIKAVANETRLLVVNAEADKYYKSKNIVVKGTQSNVVVKTSARETTAKQTTPVQQPRESHSQLPTTESPQQQTTRTTTTQQKEDNNNSPALAHAQPVQIQTSSPTVTNGHSEEDKHDDTRSVSSAASSNATSEASTQPQSPMSTSPTPPPSLEHTHTPKPTTTTTTAAAAAAVPPKPQQQQSVASNNSYNSSGLNLNMSAAEMRAMLARKKKADPRNDPLDLKKKYEIIQNM